MISSVTLGTKTDANASLVPAVTFATNATIYAEVATQNAPATAVVKAKWYATDIGNAGACNTFIDQAELTVESNIEFALAPSTKWPPGAYRVEIYVNDVLDRAVTFTVK